MQQDVSRKSARQHLVRAAALQYGLHHDERIADLRSAQDKYTGFFRLFHQLGNHAVFFLKQSPHRGRKHLLESAQRRLVPVGCRERVTDIQVSQRRELAHDLRLRLLLMRQLQLQLEQGLLFTAEAHIVQQDHLAVFHSGNRFPRRGAAHILDPRNLFSDQGRENLRMRSGTVEVLVFDVAALMGHHDDLRSGV